MRRTVLIRHGINDTKQIKSNSNVDFDMVNGATKEINGILQYVHPDKKDITAQVWNDQYHVKAKRAEEKYLDNVPSLSTILWSGGFSVLTVIITEGYINPIYSFPAIFSVFYGVQRMDRKTDLVYAYKRAMASDFVYNSMKNNSIKNKQ